MVNAARHDPPVEAALNILRYHRDDASQRLIEARDPVDIHRLQGRVQQCDDVIMMIEKPIQEINE